MPADPHYEYARDRQRETITGATLHAYEMSHYTYITYICDNGWNIFVLAIRFYFVYV